MNLLVPELTIKMPEHDDSGWIIVAGVHVDPGGSVREGYPVVTVATHVEEQHIRAPHGGIVTPLVEVGELVQSGDSLFTLQVTDGVPAFSAEEAAQWEQGEVPPVEEAAAETLDPVGSSDDELVRLGVENSAEPSDEPVESEKNDPVRLDDAEPPAAVEEEPLQTMKAWARPWRQTTAPGSDTAPTEPVDETSWPAVDEPAEARDDAPLMLGAADQPAAVESGWTAPWRETAAPISGPVDAELAPDEEALRLSNGHVGEVPSEPVEQSFRSAEEEPVEAPDDAPLMLGAADQPVSAEREWTAPWRETAAATSGPVDVDPADAADGEALWHAHGDVGEAPSEPVDQSSWSVEEEPVEAQDEAPLMLGAADQPVSAEREWTAPWRETAAPISGPVDAELAPDEEALRLSNGHVDEVPSEPVEQSFRSAEEEPVEAPDDAPLMLGAADQPVSAEREWTAPWRETVASRPMEADPVEAADADPLQLSDEPSAMQVDEASVEPVDDPSRPAAEEPIQAQEGGAQVFGAAERPASVEKEWIPPWREKKVQSPKAEAPGPADEESEQSSAEQPLRLWSRQSEKSAGKRRSRLADRGSRPPSLLRRQARPPTRNEGAGPATRPPMQPTRTERDSEQDGRMTWLKPLLALAVYLIAGFALLPVFVQLGGDASVGERAVLSGMAIAIVFLVAIFLMPSTGAWSRMIVRALSLGWLMVAGLPIFTQVSNLPLPAIFAADDGSANLAVKGDGSLDRPAADGVVDVTPRAAQK